MVEQAVSNTPEVRSEHRPRLYEIDALRFIAALMVVLVHYGYTGYVIGRSEVDFTGSIGVVAKYGYLGVDLFFLISGFVVFRSSWGRTGSQFVISRVSRLYPAYWLCMTITASILAAGWAQGRGTSLGQYLVNLTMFQPVVNVSHVEAVYWTLWTEWRFYALLFIFTLIGITARRAIWFMWAWLAASLALTFLPIPGKAALELLVQPIYAHYFIAGMALFLVYRRGWTSQLAVLVVLCCGLGVFQGIRHSHEVAEKESTTLSPVVVAIVITVIFAVMTLVASGALTRFGRRSFVTLGALTYPLYLLHESAGYALLNWLSPWINRWVLLVAVIAVMCAAAWLISTQVERRAGPALRRGLTAGRRRVRGLNTEVVHR